MMTVKQLEWKSGPRGQAASTPFGTSYILDNRDGKHWFLYRENGNGRVKLLTSEAKAKACAQEEYERLILSAVARPQSAAVRDEAPVAWACTVCNSPRSIDPCPKCGRAVTKPADGWEWPDTPDIHRIRTLAREVGYAIGVHGTMERDLDIIAMPWVAEAVMPMELAQHIASGLDGIVLDYQIQDKPCGRWSCNISPSGWFKMIDLSVMPPSLPQDIISLVIAVREFWDVNNDLSPESVALDRALNAFASRVPFENEPAPALHSTQEG